MVAWVVQFLYAGLNTARVPVNDFTGYGQVRASTPSFDVADTNCRSRVRMRRLLVQAQHAVVATTRPTTTHSARAPCPPPLAYLCLAGAVHRHLQLGLPHDRALVA